MKYILFVMAFVTLQSCSSTEEGSEVNLDVYKADMAGNMHEIYLFCDNVYWKDTLGSYVQSYLESYIPKLPQMEKRFTLFQFEIEGATKTRMTHRNVIQINISDKNQDKKVGCIKQESSWSKGQILFDITGPNMEEVMQLLETELPKIANEIETVERTRMMDKYVAKMNRHIDDQMQKTHNISITMPAESDLMENRSNFAWLQSNKLGPKSTYQVQEGVFIYDYPYTDDSTFTYNFLVAMRDSVLKQNVPGTTDEQYLQTQLLEGYEPILKEVNFNGEYAIEMRGQYRMENGFMGGPFVSITTVDKKRNRVVTIEGYVFAPKFKKRNYIKEVEAMIYSAKFTD